MSDEERAEAALANYQRSVLGGILVGSPVLLLVALGAPEWMSVGYLALVVAVLTPYVIWKRRRSRHDRA